jgi:hypothetical protein
VRRAGGEIIISNEDLYDAMMPAEGRAPGAQLSLFDTIEACATR